MAASLPGAEAHFPKAPVYNQRQAVPFGHGLGEVATALERRADHMGPVGKLPNRNPHLLPAALTQGIVHPVASVTNASVWLTVPQKIYSAHGFVWTYSMVKKLIIARITALNQSCSEAEKIGSV
jgi:hypothetical protein